MLCTVVVFCPLLLLRPKAQCKVNSAKKKGAEKKSSNEERANFLAQMRIGPAKQRAFLAREAPHDPREGPYTSTPLEKRPFLNLKKNRNYWRDKFKECPSCFKATANDIPVYFQRYTVQKTKHIFSLSRNCNRLDGCLFSPLLCPAQ